MKNSFLISTALVAIFPSAYSAEFVKDTFTASAVTSLASHTGEIGAVWSGHLIEGFGNGDVHDLNNAVINSSNRLYWAASTYFAANFTASGAPSSAEYDITAYVHSAAVSETASLSLRSRWTSTDGYEVRLGYGSIRLMKVVGNDRVDLASASINWSENHDYVIKFETKNATKKVYIDGVVVLEASDNTLTGVGLVGVAMYGGDGTENVGFLLDSISAADNSAAGQPPTISTIANQDVTTGATVGPLAITIGDPDTSANSLTLSATSTNETLAPHDTAITFGGTGTSRTITIVPAASQTGSATITVQVSDGALTASTSFVVTVSSGGTVPVITTQPTNHTVTVGDSVSFSVAATGTPTPSFQWKKNGAVITGATGATFPISSAALGDAGDYTVVASNTVGTATSSVATLTVNATPPPGGAGGVTSDDYTINIDPDNNDSAHFFAVNRGINTGTSTRLFTVLGSGFVGVGTPVPLSKLTVAGDGNDLTEVLRVERGAGNSTHLSFTHNSIQRTNSDATLGNLLLNPNGGNVGIGTSAPGQLLDVNGATRFRGTLAFGSSDNIGRVSWGMADVTGFGMQAGSGLALTLGSNGNWNQVVISTAGNVGIGVTAPRALLDVEGGAVVLNGLNGGIYTTGVETPFNGAGVLLRGKGATPYVIAQTGTADGTSAFSIYNSSNTEVFHVGGNGSSYFNLGSVGIGMINTWAKLDVAGQAHFGTGSGNITTDNLANTSNGLSVQDASGAEVAIAVGRNKVNSAGLIWHDGGVGAELYTFSHVAPITLGASAIQMVTGGGYAFVLDNNSNVGIGTTTPTGRLDVDGNVVIRGSLKTDINGNAESSLTLGSDHVPGQGGSLRLQSSQGGSFRFSDEAGKFTLRRENVNPAELLKFETNVAEFASSIKAHGLDVENLTIQNVARPFSDTDAANMAYVKETNPFEWSSPASSAYTKPSITAVGIGTGTATLTRTFQTKGSGPLFFLDDPSLQPTIKYYSGGVHYGALHFQHTFYTNGWGAEIRNEDVGSAGGNLSLMTTPRNTVAIDTNAVPLRRMEVTSEGLIRIFHKQNESFGWEFSVQDSGGTDDGADAGGLAFRQAVKADLSPLRPYNAITHFWISPVGDVGIGTTHPNGYKLAVNGSIHAKEVVVDSDPAFWPDYVFAETHRLMPLDEVENHIKEHKHLPGVPSAAEVGEKGVGIGQMQAVLLAKVEELTLHLIEQDKRIKKLEEENIALRSNR